MPEQTYHVVERDAGEPEYRTYRVTNPSPPLFGESGHEPDDDYPGYMQPPGWAVGEAEHQLGSDAPWPKLHARAWELAGADDAA